MTYDEATENIGIHNGELKALTLQALASGRIDAYQARQYLDLRLSERLPTGYGVADEDARPLVTLRRRAMNRVVSWLVAEGLDATYWFTSVERTPSGWAAQIFDEDDAPAGRVLLSRDLETAEFRPA